MTETWRAVPGHPHYEVSDLGRLRAIACVLTRKHPKTLKPHSFNYKPRMLRPITTQYGYQQVNLDGRVIFLHRVVLAAFVGPRPEGMQACHGNGNRADNRLANLRWDTPKENAADRIRHGTQSRGRQVERAA